MNSLQAFKSLISPQAFVAELSGTWFAVWVGFVASFAFCILLIMFTGAIWYTPPPKKQATQKKQFNFVEKTSNNVTYDRSDLF